MKTQKIDGIVICCGLTIQGIGVSKENAYKNFEKNCFDRRVLPVPPPDGCLFFKAKEMLVE